MAHMASRVRIKRIYDPAEADDGARMLVDRIWPRGMTKEAAALDEWLKDLAPSDALRRWFGHAPERWPDFKARYARELAANPALARLRAAMKEGPVTLLYAARDPIHNNAAALAEFLRTGAARQKPRA
jgi:uncharacterized protein YeaO (DUF488 family)